MAANAALARAAIVAVSLLLLWRAIHVNVGLHDESGVPRVAAEPPRAGAGTGRDEDALRRLLDENPAEIAALLMIAQERERTGDLEGASKAYRVVLDLAPRDRQVLALASAHFLRRDDPAGLELLAQLADGHPAARPDVFPAMARLLASPRHRAAIARIAVRDAAWVGPFLADACRRGTDPSLIAPLVMQAAPSAKAPDAAYCVIDRLRGTGQWEQAYHLWLNLLPRERRARLGYVFNGGFETPPSHLGFDWILQQAPEKQAGHTAEIVRVPGTAGQRALRVAYNGNRQTGVPARQYLLLPEGRYELTGSGRPEGIKAARGLHWTVRCVKADQVSEIVARSERFIGSSDWRRFSLEFAADGACSGYALQLEPVLAREGEVAFVSGVAWFDDLALGWK
jgi:hypothetical protein